MNAVDIIAAAYIDANILLFAALVAWSVICRALAVTGVSNSRSTQLRLLRVGILCAVLTPAVMSALIHTTALRTAGLLPSMSLSDYMISQYIQGRIDLKPSQLLALIDGWQGLANSLTIGNSRLGSLLTAALAIGSLACVFGLVRSILDLRRALLDCHVWRTFGKLHVLLSDTIPVPFAARTLRGRYIVLPSNLLCHPRDLRFAIAHEAQHLRNGDVAWEIILVALKPLFFWNPAFLLLKARAEKLRELACDRAILNRRRYPAADYCCFLLNVSDRCFQPARLKLVTMPTMPISSVGLLNFGKRSEPALRQRVLALLGDEQSPERAPVSLGSGLVLAAVMVLAWAIVREPAAVSVDRLHLSTLANLEMMASNRTERGYGLVMSY